MATPGKVGRVLTQSAAVPIAFTNEATTANTAKTRYTITNVAKRYWDLNTPITVKKDGVTQTTGFNLEYPGGVVVFPTSQGAAAITVTGEYVTMEQLAGFFNWSLNVNNKTIDVTDFESGEWEEFILGTKSFTASAEKYWASNADFSHRIGEQVLVVLYTDFGTPKTRFEGYATLNTTAGSVPVDGLINDKLDFSGKNGIYYREG